MKLFGKILLYIIAGVIVLLIAGFSYLMIAFPAVGDAKDIKIELTPERIARGEYLYHNVSMCGDCHTERQWDKYSAPTDETVSGGGNVTDFVEKAGFPGDFYAANITPKFKKSWTDGELLRAITCGVSKDGRPLFPVMPYMNYGKMSKEDIYSIIAYVRTLNPVDKIIPVSKPKFPMTLIMKMMPKEAEFGEIPSKSDAVKYGQYMANAAACSDCHTPMEKGKPMMELAYAGGREFPIPTGGVVQSANITPDKNYGIGNWSKEMFIARFKGYADSNYVFHKVEPNTMNTIMPWKKYSGMKEEDLGAIYDYLMTMKPVNKGTVRFTPGK
jgi:mono/diheme cytochrome c family protein